jgi:hypothetical protein
LYSQTCVTYLTLAPANIRFDNSFASAVLVMVTSFNSSAGKLLQSVADTFSVFDSAGSATGFDVLSSLQPYVIY